MSYWRLVNTQAEPVPRFEAMEPMSQERKDASYPNAVSGDILWSPEEVSIFEVTEGDPNYQTIEVDGENISLAYDEEAHNNAAWTTLRAARDAKLSATDFRYRRDIQDIMTQQQKDDWDAYCQALRDVPENTEDPKTFDYNNDWPVEPT